MHNIMCLRINNILEYQYAHSKVEFTQVQHYTRIATYHSSIPENVQIHIPAHHSPQVENCKTSTLYIQNKYRNMITQKGFCLTMHRPIGGWQCLGQSVQRNVAE